MSSNLKVNTILPSAGTAIGIGTAGGNLNVDGGCKVQVGTALTLGHTQGLQFHTQNLHSTGFEVNNVNASGIITATKFVGPFENTGDFTIDDYIVHAGDTDTKFGFSSADTFSVETGGTERFLIQSDGSIGINAPVPSAGDLASGDSQNKPLLHVNGSGASATTGEYNLLARFEAGGDADGTGAMIVLNHANDRGLAIQGGRRTGNYAHGALKMIDNVGRVSDAMLIHGGAGQGVDHINFYTGISTITTNRLHIDNAGRVLIGTTNTSNGHVAASKATVHGHLSIFKDSGGDNAGVDSHQLKFVTQSGSIAEIMATSAGAGGPAGRGGYLSLFAKPNNSGTLKEMLRVTDTGVAFLRQDTSSEGGEVSFTRASDNTSYYWVDTYGSGSQPRFRLHGGDGGELASISSDGGWYIAPHGTIMNVGYARYDPNQDSYSTISQDTRGASAVYLDYTPRRSDSKLIIMTRMHTRMINAYGCSYGIEQSTNGGSSYSDVDGMAQRNAMDFFYKGDAVNHHFTGFCMRQIDSYSGTRRFRPWGQGWANGTWEISYGHGEHSVTIYEVAV